MLSRAHVGVGVSAALVVVQPLGAASCVACALAAAAGSLICDIDVRSSEHQRDAFRMRMMVLVLCCLALAYDLGRGGVVVSSLVAHFGPELVMGAAGFVATCVVGALSSHRSFAHSLVALALWSASLELLCPVLVIPFAVGVVSHLLLDLTTKQGLRLFWPLNAEVSLGLWKSDGFMNNVLAVVGACASVLLFAFGVCH